MLQVFTIASQICVEMKEKLPVGERYGAPQQYHQQLYTIVHMADKLDVEELLDIQDLLREKMGRAFVLKGLHDETVIDPIVAANIDMHSKQSGLIIERMIELA